MVKKRKKEEKKRKKRKKGGKNWDLKYFFKKSTCRFFSYAQCFFLSKGQFRVLSMRTIPEAGNRKVVWVLSFDHFQIRINTVYR